MDINELTFSALSRAYQTSGCSPALYAATSKAISVGSPIVLNFVPSDFFVSCCPDPGRNRRVKRCVNVPPAAFCSLGGRPWVERATETLGAAGVRDEVLEMISIDAFTFKLQTRRANSSGAGICSANRIYVSLRSAQQ